MFFLSLHYNLKQTIIMENLTTITTEQLIKELNNRGYNTSLLISKWDVVGVLEEENKEQSDDEQIELSDEDMNDIVKNIDTEYWQRQINENITNTIQDDYNNEDYYVSKESDFEGNAIYVSVWDDGERVETSCIFNPETKEVTDVDVMDVDNMDLDICTNEFIEYKGEIFFDFKMDDGVWENGQRIE